MTDAQAHRRLATVAVLLGLVVSAFEGSVVTTAMPAIASSLGGSDLYAWVFASFLLTSTMGVLVCGRLADSLGRRPVFIAGMAVFLVGSMLSGFAQSVGALVFFRALQGMGAGAIHPVAMTVAADLYSVRERARIQGVFTSVWGLSNLAGPAIGSLLVEHASWRWVFFVNVPVGVVAALVLWFSYSDPPRGSTSTSTASAWLLGAALVLGLFGLEPVGGMGPLSRIVSAAFAIVFGFLLLTRERKTAEPLIERALYPDKTIQAGFFGNLIGGAVFYGATAYLPLWITRDTSMGATGAAIALTCLLVGWASGSTLGVRVYLRYGLRVSAGGGLALFAIMMGAISFCAFTHHVSWVVPLVFFAGAGIGPTLSTSVVGPQSKASFRNRAMVTSALFGTRTLGGALVVAALGNDANWSAPNRFACLAAMALVSSVALSFFAPGPISVPSLKDPTGA